MTPNSLQCFLSQALPEPISEEDHHSSFLSSASKPQAARQTSTSTPTSRSNTGSVHSSSSSSSSHHAPPPHRPCPKRWESCFPQPHTAVRDQWVACQSLRAHSRAHLDRGLNSAQLRRRCTEFRHGRVLGRRLRLDRRNRARRIAGQPFCLWALDRISLCFKWTFGRDWFLTLM